MKRTICMCLAALGALLLSAASDLPSRLDVSV